MEELILPDVFSLSGVGMGAESVSFTFRKFWLIPYNTCVNVGSVGSIISSTNLPRIENGKLDFDFVWGIILVFR